MARSNGKILLFLLSCEKDSLTCMCVNTYVLVYVYKTHTQGICVCGFVYNKSQFLYKSKRKIIRSINRWLRLK